MSVFFKLKPIGNNLLEINFSCLSSRYVSNDRYLHIGRFFFFGWGKILVAHTELTNNRLVLYNIKYPLLFLICERLLYHI